MLAMAGPFGRGSHGCCDGVVIPVVRGSTPLISTTGPAPKISILLVLGLLKDYNLIDNSVVALRQNSFKNLKEFFFLV